MNTVQTDEEGFCFYNPLGKPISELPSIYGFSNGGGGWGIMAQLITQDGVPIGTHICSAFHFMYGDLAITNPLSSRHESFREYYPDGYQLEMVIDEGKATHPGLIEAIRMNGLLPSPEESNEAKQ
jgi:hypothetical protein